MTEDYIVTGRLRGGGWKRLRIKDGDETRDRRSKRLKGYPNSATREIARGESS